MSSYERPEPSIDAYIEEIPEGVYRVRLVGTIVNKTHSGVILNDGTGQIDLFYGQQEADKVSIGKMGRCIAQIQRTDDELKGTMIAWNPMTADQAKRYRRLIKLERRIPR